MTTFYDFSAKNLKDETISMAQFKGKVVLVVNTASKCGFTPQFAELEDLYKEHMAKGLVIIGFPCNQFAGQEPNDANGIAEFCTLNYGVTFPMFAKIEVNGDNAHPLYKWLKNQLHGKLGDAIKWNFTKFLIGSDGTPIKRYSPTTKPKDIEGDIINALNIEQ